MFEGLGVMEVWRGEDEIEDLRVVIDYEMEVEWEEGWDRRCWRVGKGLKCVMNEDCLVRR